MRAESKLDENALFEKWKETSDPRYFQGLYQSMKPMLHKAAEKASYGSNIPQAAHEIWAAQSMLNALNTYKPDAASSLQTHVYGAVHQKAKRLNYMYQNLGQVSESRAIQVGNYQNAVQVLKERLGRAPSNAEISDYLDMNLKDVERLSKEIHKDLSLTGLEEAVINITPREEELLALLYYDLTREEQLVYDLIFGKHGRSRHVKTNQRVDFAKVSKEAGFSVSKVRTLWKSVAKKFEQAGKR
jgi:DNA-directed RNA polymerase specialized sigma subunit